MYISTTNLDLQNTQVHVDVLYVVPKSLSTVQTSTRYTWNRLLSFNQIHSTLRHPTSASKVQPTLSKGVPKESGISMHIHYKYMYLCHIVKNYSCTGYYEETLQQQKSFYHPNVHVTCSPPHTCNTTHWTQCTRLYPQISHHSILFTDLPTAIAVHGQMMTSKSANTAMHEL